MCVLSLDYICFQINGGNLTSFTFKLLLFKVPPRIIPFAFEEGPAQTGQFITLQCTVPEGDLPLSIQWKLNGQIASVNLGITTTKVGQRSSLLTIDSVDEHHSGNYTCQAENRASSQNYTSVLMVNG